MPCVAGREERRQIVVVRQIVLIVITHSTRPDRIVRRVLLARRIEEVVHRERTTRECIRRAPCRIAADQVCIVMALIPRGREVLRTNRCLVERLGRPSCVVIGESDRRIKGIDGLRVGYAELCEAPGPVSSQLPEVHVERAILLKHEENVLDHARVRVGYVHRC